MKCEQQRIHRTNVNEEVTSHYAADKDFTISYADAHIVAASMHHFEIDSVNDVPANTPQLQMVKTLISG